MKMPEPMNLYFAHHSSFVDEGAQIGSGTKYGTSATSIERKNCRTAFRSKRFVADDVEIGNNCKIQNNVSIYSGTVLELHIPGPSCVFTNVTNPQPGGPA
jgi:UDP-2-acetamido-3-amino-2,3-dideoxy-glucuronate N-acetyltransferase